MILSKEEKIKIPKERRIKRYRELIKREEGNNWSLPICSFFLLEYNDRPENWKGTIEKYPELSVYKEPKYVYSISMRKKIISSLKARINKKKDIFRKQTYKKK